MYSINDKTRHLSRTLAIWFFLGCYPGALTAQLSPPTFERISNRQLEGTVWSIAQDTIGFLWLATPTGLYRYDGYDLLAYTNHPDDPSSLSNSDVMAVYVDRLDDVWVGTRGGGLNRLVRSEERFDRFRHDPEDSNSLSSDSVWRILEDRQGTLWVATLSGLNRFDREAQSFTRYHANPQAQGSLSDDRIWFLLEDPEGRLWIGTDSGLDLFDPESQSFVHYRHDPEDRSSLRNDRVAVLATDPSGELWVGTIYGVDRFDPEEGSFSHQIHDLEKPGGLTPSSPRAIHIDSSGDIWIGTDEGLDRIRRATGIVDHYHHHESDTASLSNDSVLCIFEDQDGILWFGTRQGLNRFDPLRERFGTVRPRPGMTVASGGRRVRSILEDSSGALWVGSLDSGLHRIDRDSGSVETFRGAIDDPRALPGDGIVTLLEDQSKELWIGTINGLSRFDRSGKTFHTLHHDPQDPQTLSSDQVNNLLEDTTGNLWIATTRGLDRLDNDRDQLIRYEVAQGKNVGALAQDRAGFVWFSASGEGLYRLPNETHPLQHFKHDPDDPNSFSGNEITVLFEDSHEALWLGGLSSGLSRLDPERRSFRHYRMRDGLPSEAIVGIVEDESGDLWLSSYAGLTHFEPATGVMRNYDRDSGLQGDTFYDGAAYRSASGELFFGGVNGYNAFYPDQIVRHERPPRVVLTELQLFNIPVPLRRRDPSSPLAQSLLLTDRVTLSHRDNVFAFAYAALHFAAPAKNRYAYRLRGFDKEWVETGAQRRFAQYTSLRPGDYTFEIKASNVDGVWGPATTLGIKIEPPLWETWWAFSLYGLGLIAAAFILARSQQQKIDRERGISAKLRQVDQLRDEFLANTSHELRTPLYGITGLAESLLEESSGELPASAKTHLEMIAASGRRLGNLVNDLLDFSKLKRQGLELAIRAVELHTLADIVLTMSKPLAEGKDIELINAVDPHLPTARGDSGRLQQVLLNLVGNAIKFTDSGSVEISARKHEEELVVEVRDTGVGIEADKIHRIFESFEQGDASATREFGGTGLGLSVSRQLVELHGGELHVTSTPELGSVFFFNLPMVTEPLALIEATGIRSADPVRSIEPTPTVTAPGSDNRGATILAVDDEPLILHVLSAHLHPVDYRVLRASNGLEALRLVDEEFIDLVLLDVMMPRMSGYEVCRKLRKRHRMEELPILFLSAKTRQTDRIAGFREGANDYLAKPISKDELLARVKLHLQLLAAHRNQSEEVKILRGLLPICAVCKNIRDDEGSWGSLELYIDRHSEARFTHGMCPNCKQSQLGKLD